MASYKREQEDWLIDENIEDSEQFELEYNTETVYDDPCIERVREIRFE